MEDELRNRMSLEFDLYFYELLAEGANALHMPIADFVNALDERATIPVEIRKFRAQLLGAFEAGFIAGTSYERGDK